MADRPMIVRMFAAAAVVLAAACAGGCGVRSALEAPPQAKVAGVNATAETTTDPGKGSVEKPKPHKDFLLDGLLR